MPTGTQRGLYRDIGSCRRDSEQPVRRGGDLLLLDALLVGGDPLEPAHRRHHREEQMELGVLGDERLDEEHAALGIEAGSQPVSDHLDRVGRHLPGIEVVWSRCQSATKKKQSADS
jgi:hypothetical protein